MGLPEEEKKKMQKFLVPIADLVNCMAKIRQFVSSVRVASNASGGMAKDWETWEAMRSDVEDEYKDIKEECRKFLDNLP